MSVHRYVTPAGRVRYRARVKSQGRGATSRVFDRRVDAVAWEQDQSRRLRLGDWHDPRRGQMTLEAVAKDWLASRTAVKRRTYESDLGAWRRYIAPKWASRQVASITTSEISIWVAQLMDRGLARSTVSRTLATLRLIFAFAVEDRRIATNPASKVKPPAGGKARREGQMLDPSELLALAEACHGRYRDVVVVLGLQGLRWGELAGLQVGDRVSRPGPGLRIKRALLSSNGGGELFVDSVKNKHARTVPLVPLVVPIIARWSDAKPNDAWLFSAPEGGPLRERNWQRSVHWKEALKTIGRPTLRVHDLRHTAASIWLGAGADPKVVQRVLGHASATMTMDLYGHLIDRNLWQAAAKVGDTMGTRAPDSDDEKA